MKIPGIHHISAICSDPQQNLDFYTGLLGLRLVKRTVNFDDPGMYHLYYGDEVGTPGTIMTFFPIPGLPRGRRGAGEVSVTAFAIPEASLGYWIDRFVAAGVPFHPPVMRFDERVLAFADPDGLQLELVTSAAPGPGWQGGPIPPEHAIRSFHSATLCVQALEPTESVLANLMGFRLLAQEGNRHRYEMSPGAVIDLVTLGARRGVGAGGSVHHIAFRVADEAELQQCQQEIEQRGLRPTPVKDREYFRSVYFREPGGVLFELATDGPGFAVDEPVETLGRALKLPPWLEPERERVERALAPLRVPS